MRSHASFEGATSRLRHLLFRCSEFKQTKLNFEYFQEHRKNSHDETIDKLTKKLETLVRERDAAVTARNFLNVSKSESLSLPRWLKCKGI